MPDLRSILPDIEECINNFMGISSCPLHKSENIEESFISSVIESRKNVQLSLENNNKNGSFVRSLIAGEPAGGDFISNSYKLRILELLIPERKIAG